MLFVQADVVKTQGSVNASMDLALGCACWSLARWPGRPGQLHPRAQAAGPEQRPGRVAGGRRAPVCLIQFSEVDAVQPLPIVPSAANGVIE